MCKYIIWDWGLGPIPKPHPNLIKYYIYKIMKDETKIEENKPNEDEKYIKFKKLQKQLEPLEIHKIISKKNKQFKNTICQSKTRNKKTVRYSFNDRTIQTQEVNIVFMLYRQ